MEAPRLDGAVEEEVEREGSIGRLGEELRLEDGDAGIDEGDHLPFAAPPQQAARVHVEIATAIIAEARRRRREKKEDIHRILAPSFDEPRQVGLGPFDPK